MKSDARFCCVHEYAENGDFDAERPYPRSVSIIVDMVIRYLTSVSIRVYCRIVRLIARKKRDIL